MIHSLLSSSLVLLRSSCSRLPARGLPPFRSLCLPHKRSEAVTWLVESRGISSEVADELLKTLRQAGAPATRSSLMGMEEAVLQQLIDSISKEVNETNKKIKETPSVSVTVLNPRESTRIKVKAFIGETLLTTIPIIPDLEFACEGNASCSTCHVMVEPKFYDLIAPPDEHELDMLDLAWEPTEYSRLCCQLVVNKSCDGMSVTVPYEANNLL